MPVTLIEPIRDGDSAHSSIMITPGETEAGGAEQPPVVIVTSPNSARVRRLVAAVRKRGFAAHGTRSAAGCVRVAAGARPTLIVLDAELNDATAELLRRHPETAEARIARLM